VWLKSGVTPHLPDIETDDACGRKVYDYRRQKKKKEKTKKPPVRQKQRAGGFFDR
jgi:hypothetical protein